MRVLLPVTWCQAAVLIVAVGLIEPLGAVTTARAVREWMRRG